MHRDSHRTRGIVRPRQVREVGVEQLIFRKGRMAIAKVVANEKFLSVRDEKNRILCSVPAGDELVKHTDEFVG